MLITGKPYSLSRQIAVYTIFFVLLVAITMITVTRYLMADVMMDSAKTYVSSLTAENINRIEAKLFKSEIIARNLRYVVQQGLADAHNMSTMIETLLRQNPEISSVAIAYEPGRGTSRESRLFFIQNGVYKHLPLEYDSIEFRDWYSVTRYSGEWRWSEPWYCVMGANRLISSLSVPITIDGRFGGILRVDLDVKTLQELIAKDTLASKGELFLISNNGVIVSHQSDSLLMNYSIFAMAEVYEDTQLRQIGKRMIEGHSGFEQLKSKSPLQGSWIAFAPLKSNGWSSAVILSNQEIFSELYRLNVIQVLASLMAFLLLIVIVIVRVRQINRPLASLCEAAEEFGKGNFDVILAHDRSYKEIVELTDAFERMRNSLRDYIRDLGITTIEKNRIMGEVSFASTIQNKLIPNNSKDYSFKDSIKIFGILEPAGDVGGDLYDYFSLDENKLCFVIADVTGKGIVASMTMTMVSTFLRAKASHHDRPGSLMEDLNKYLCEYNIEENFVTMILGCIDLKLGQLHYANAGHVPLFVRKNDCSYTKFAETQSTALGLFAQLHIPDVHLQLDPGDELILITDGITEAMSESENFFGIDRLEEIIGGLQNPNPETTAKAIQAAAQRFSNPEHQHDDITILVIEFVHPIHT